MYVACSTLCFARYPLDRALRIIGELEFSKLDVAIHESGPHLKPSQVAADVAQAAQRIRIGPSLTPAAFDVEIEAPNDKEALAQWKAICKLARMSTVSVVTIAAAASGVGLDAEVGRLKKLVHLVNSEGLVLTVATRIGTLTELPATALELCERVPGLGLTLDPSHFINGPHQGASYDELFPYVKHVHLRDTGRAPGKFQVRVGQGEIEYGRIINQLEREDYDRLLTVAVQDVADAPFAMETEVRKLKFLLESLV
ncbi:MAG TPA: sugar phosphate isomerase/epimerase [Gemmataceae bacterium]|nr:sugar phosphate isomerase/epimerase [Gemmataceae bacterium]